MGNVVYESAGNPVCNEWDVIYCALGMCKCWIFKPQGKNHHSNFNLSYPNSENFLLTVCACTSESCQRWSVSYFLPEWKMSLFSLSRFEKTTQFKLSCYEISKRESHRDRNVFQPEAISCHEVAWSTIRLWNKGGNSLMISEDCVLNHSTKNDRFCQEEKYCSSVESNNVSKNISHQVMILTLRLWWL